MFLKVFLLGWCLGCCGCVLGVGFVWVVVVVVFGCLLGLG